MNLRDVTVQWRSYSLRRVIEHPASEINPIEGRKRLKGKPKSALLVESPSFMRLHPSPLSANDSPRDRSRVSASRRGEKLKKGENLKVGIHLHLDEEIISDRPSWGSHCLHFLRV